MPTPRETMLTAPLVRLSALPAVTLRGEVLPERIPAEGLLILRDGEPGGAGGDAVAFALPLRAPPRDRGDGSGRGRDDALDTLNARIGIAVT